MTSLNNRKTIRKYQDKEVPSDLLNYLLRRFRMHSNNGNLQLYSVVSTTNAENKARLAPAHFNQPMVTQAPVVLTFCADFNRTTQWALHRKGNPGYNNFLSFLNAVSDTLLYCQPFAIWQRLKAQAVAIGYNALQSRANYRRFKIYLLW